jgi:polyisoprenoid-binding protein YceI
MKKAALYLSLLFSFSIITAFTYFISNWNIDPNYSIKFSGKKAEGTFTGFTGTIVFEPNDLAHSHFDVAIDANTIKTGNSTKDDHAKDASWLNTEKYPKIKFRSNTITKEANGFQVTGILELHGTEKQIKLPFSFIEVNGKSNFMGNFKINRKDYGIKGNLFGFVVGDEFEVSINLPVSKK